MRKTTIGLLALSLLVLIGCSGGKAECMFASPNFICDDYTIDQNQVTIQAKNTLESPIQFTNEGFALHRCTDAQLVSVNGDTSLETVINKGDKVTLVISCLESLDTLGNLEIELSYENQDTGIKDLIPGQISQ